MKLLRRPVVVCQQWTEMITDYLEGALPKNLVKAIDRHLSGCPHCTEYLAQMRRTIQVNGAINGTFPSEPVPAEMINALQRAFEEFHHKPGA